MTTARGPEPATITGLPLQLGAPDQLDGRVERVAVEVGDHALRAHPDKVRPRPDPTPHDGLGGAGALRLSAS